MDESQLDSAQHLPLEPIVVQASDVDDEHMRRAAVLDEFRRYNRRMWRIATILFVLTCLSTWYAWSSRQAPDGLRGGVVYAVAVMSILVAHEFGHYLQSLRYRVPATPPLFIPTPFFPFGTMGALILQAGQFANRKALFDIAISGPLAGLVLALPMTWYGLQQSPVIVIEPKPGEPIYGVPLVLKWMIDIQYGELAPGEGINESPLLFAGWVGIFVTALNLVPIGQLDGGHILYTLIGQRAHRVALALMILAGTYMALTHDLTYLIMLVLLFLMGPRHPPTANDHVPLGPVRMALGWLTLAFVLIGFTPRPVLVFNFVPEPEAEPQHVRPNLDERAVEFQNVCPSSGNALASVRVYHGSLRQLPSLSDFDR